jgi:hypothetical protein
MESEGEGEELGGFLPLELHSRLRKADKALATVVLPTNLIEVIASEIAVGVDRAVECWMSQIEHALTDVHLTSLGRLNAVREILDEYKHLTGKVQLQGRGSSALPEKVC